MLRTLVVAKYSDAIRATAKDPRTAQSVLDLKVAELRAKATITVLVQVSR